MKELEEMSKAAEQLKIGANRPSRINWPELDEAAEGLMSLSAYKQAANSQDGLTTPALHRPDKPVKGVQEPLSAFLMGSRDKTVIETAKHFFKGGL